MIINICLKHNFDKKILTNILNEKVTAITRLKTTSSPLSVQIFVTIWISNL